MSAVQWDPEQYARYRDERARPFFDLIDQIGAAAPFMVVDLGCGSGQLTAALAERWPGAVVRGVDSSAEMIEAASKLARPSLSFALGEAGQFSANGVDVLVSNALLQWVPGHISLLQRWASELNPGGWIAFQVPSNFGGRSHTLMRELAESPHWRDRLGTVLRGIDAVAGPDQYLEALAVCGLEVNVWQTVYMHVLQGDNPVLDWVRGTALRPVMQALTEEELVEFEATYSELLRTAYPKRSFGTVFPFPRTFVVAHKP